MSKQLIDGVWVIICDWVDESGNSCNLGLYGEPKMFVDPDGGRTESKHYQCGAHHGIVKQEDRPEYQVPKDHKLANTENENVLIRKDVDENVKDIGIHLAGFKPDAEGRVWDGSAITPGEKKNV